jgi:hypothetical protein
MAMHLIVLSLYQKTSKKPKPIKQTTEPINQTNKNKKQKTKKKKNQLLFLLKLLHPLI